MRPPPMRLTPVTLHGRLVRLEPLGPEHVSDLLDAAGYDGIWTYLDEATPRTAAAMEQLVKEALEEQQRGERLPFAVIEVDSQRAVGSVSFIDVQPVHHGLEIGWGWITPSQWGTGAMREAVLLLLDHAFTQLRAIRVAFKTDARNLRSQGALAAIGATREGHFRRHRILSDGHMRDSIYYSITDQDWPGIRQRPNDRHDVSRS